MKAQVGLFLKKLTLILLPFLVLFIWTEYKARQLPNSYAVKKKDFERVQDSVEVLVFGSSHALKGIDPSFFSCKGFNFSNSSQTLVHDAWICEHYLDHLPGLKAVIFDISYISFWFDLRLSPESWRDYFYYHYFGMKEADLDLCSPPAFFYSAMYTKGMVNDIIFNRVDSKKEFGDIKPGGWERTEAPSDSATISEQSGLQRVRLHESLRKQESFIRIMPLFERTLDELRQRDLGIFFVTPPVYRTYYDQLDPVKEKENREIIDALCRKYGVVYIDYSKDPRFQKGEFSDNDHLNRIGAAKFSRILNEEMLSPFCGN